MQEGGDGMFPKMEPSTHQLKEICRKFFEIRTHVMSMINTFLCDSVIDTGD